MNPFAQSDLERELSPPPSTLPAAYRMGGLAGLENYDATPSWGAIDRAQRAAQPLIPRETVDPRTLGPELQREMFLSQMQRRAPGGAVSMQPRMTAAGSFDQPLAAVGREVVSTMVPSSPGEAALMFAGGPIGGRALKTGAGVIGALAEMTDPAEAGVRDPRLWSAISKTKLNKPLSEMEHRYTDVRTPVPKFVAPEDLVGGYGVFTPWDLSAANKTLTHVDALKLADPVRLHGGVGFPEANPGLAAASEQAISRRIDNQAADLAEKTGKPVYIMPMTMSPSGVDASHHVADPLAQLTQTAKITKKDADAFDAVMRESVKDWTGIKDKGFLDYIRNLKGGMTTKSEMARVMALGRWQEKGFPDVAAIRHAVSEPTLIEQPRNTVGMTISRYTPGRGLLETTHPSYPKGVAGEHMGQLASLIPFEDAAPAIAAALAPINARYRELGKNAITPAYHLGKPTPGVPTTQYFDQEWADRIRRRWGDLK